MTQICKGSPDRQVMFGCMKFGISQNMNNQHTKEPPIDFYFLLTEFNLFILIWHIWRKRRIVVIQIVQIMPLTANFLSRIVTRYRKAGKLFLLFEDYGHLVTYKDYTECESQADPFTMTEPWMEEHFEFNDVERRLNNYSLAFKHLICNHTKTYPFLCYTIENILKRSSDEKISVIGANSDTRELFRFIFNRDCGPRVPVGFGGAVWMNTILAIGLFTYTFGWILWRTRLRLRPAEEVFLGSDLAGDPRLANFWKEVQSAGKQVKVIIRSQIHEQTVRDRIAGFDLDDWPHCLSTEGRFSLFSAVAALSLLLKDICKIYCHLRSQQSGIFFQAVKFPFFRVKYRSLFSRFKFANYFGRDDYNVEHIIRSQELRRIQGRSFGMLHGLPAEPPITPIIRYIDFDVYYVFGLDWYERFYKSRWPKSMQVRAVGSFGMSSKQLDSLKEPRPRNIVCFVKEKFGDEIVLGEILKIAKAFPDRKIIIKPKGIPEGDYRQKIDRLLSKSPSNLVDASGQDSYEQFLNCSYSLSESSTLVIEAIQFGLVSFAMLMDPKLTRNNYYRRFPDLVYEKADSIIDRIRAVESGDWHYDRTVYKDLVDLSGRVIWDVILSDMGVENIDCTPLPHLIFSPALAEGAT